MSSIHKKMTSEGHFGQIHKLLNEIITKEKNFAITRKLKRLSANKQKLQYKRHTWANGNKFKHFQKQHVEHYSDNVLNYKMRNCGMSTLTQAIYTNLLQKDFRTAASNIAQISWKSRTRKLAKKYQK